MMAEGIFNARNLFSLIKESPVCFNTSIGGLTNQLRGKFRRSDGLYFIFRYFQADHAIRADGDIGDMHHAFQGVPVKE